MRFLKLGLNGSLLVLAMAGGYLVTQHGWDVGSTSAGATPSAPAAQAMPVPVVGVVKKTIPIYLEYAARTEAIRNVTLRAKASGYLLEQPVADGTDVKAGDLLYEIRAPFAGRLGRNQAPEGTLVASSAGTPLNNLVQLSLVYITFNPGETELAEIQKAFADGTVDSEVIIPGSDGKPRQGKLTFIDNAVERNTDTIAARATIENLDFSLLPGQYVRIRLHIRELPNALMVPQTAPGSSQFGKYVYVVGKDNLVERRVVALGPTDGDLVTLTNGIKEGDKIIAGNLQKIFPGHRPNRSMPAAVDHFASCLTGAQEIRQPHGRTASRLLETVSFQPISQSWARF